MWFLEQLIQTCLKWLVDQTGLVGQIISFLIVGLSLIVGGPLYMSRENRRRRIAERRPRYGWIEYVIIVSGGFVFAAVGLALLVSSD
jgi:hypothetical protein